MNKEFAFVGPFQNIKIKNVILPGLLGLVLVSMAIGVVFTKHRSRILYTQLHAFNLEKNRLNNEWSQLLLENATWTSSLRVEKIAIEQLQMIMPTKIEMIKP